jgi:hypothetical protein
MADGRLAHAAVFDPLFQVGDCRLYSDFSDPGWHLFDNFANMIQPRYERNIGLFCRVEPPSTIASLNANGSASAIRQ